MVASSKMKQLRVKFLSMSVVVTSLALIILQGLHYLHLEKIIVLPQVIIRIINSISLVIATLFFTSLLLRLTIKRVFYFFDEAEERIFYSKIYTWTLYSIGLFYIMYYFGVSLGNITIFIGLIATGLAFAVRDVLLSFFGWMILLRKKPFRIGDYIRIGEDEGKVMHIGTFYVLLDKTHNLPEDFTRVPNRLFLEKSITILGKQHFLDQVSFLLGGMPENKNFLLLDLKNDIQKILKESAFVSVNTDMKNEKLFLIVEYLVSFETWQSARAEIIDACFSKFQPYITLPKL